MNVLEINQTDKAKKKLANIAKKCDLDYDFVYPLFSFFWNYDGIKGDWVESIDEDDEYKKRYEFIFDRLGLKNESLSKSYIIDGLNINLLSNDVVSLKNRFLHGCQNGNYGLISEYASYFYLKNGTKEKLETLEWNIKSSYTRKKIVENVFKKLFRGGSVDRDNLEYLYADLAVFLPYNQYFNNIVLEDWSNDFVKNIKAKTLTELTKELRHYCKGDKYFLQTILEALSFSGVIKVPNHDISNYFIPDYRKDSIEIYSSNEWAYPLRFWNIKSIVTRKST